MSVQESIKLTIRDSIATIEFDLIGEKVNKLSTPIMARFSELLDELGRGTAQVCILISRKPTVFIAGADIEEIKNLKDTTACMAAVESGQQIINKIEDLDIPIIAAIHGACAGGGCELVLACDYRIASDDKSTRIGLPEVKLGVIPGFGGCVRLPRVVGLEAALDVILAGKLLPASKALKIGLVDEVVAPTLLEKRAHDFARSLIDSKRTQKRKKTYTPSGVVKSLLNSFIGRQVVFSQARKGVVQQSRGHYPAPLEALNVIQRTYGMGNRARALKIEAEGFGRVGPSEVSKNLIHVFYLLEGAKKPPPFVKSSGVEPVEIDSAGVLGAGTMGAGIAQLMATSGLSVRLKDVSAEVVAKGLEAAQSIWANDLKKKRITSYELQRMSSNLTGGMDFNGFGRLKLVIEAIVEDMEVKKKVISETASHMLADCIFATNTSSLSVTEMATAHPHPQRFVGMHFFNPVSKMPLVEVIKGAQTSDATVAGIVQLCKKLGKTGVVVKDSPGFLVNRLLFPWLGECLFMLQEGMAIDKIDRIYTHDFGMPMGPFHLMDEVGIDVCAKVSKVFHQAFGERAAVCELQSKIIETGRLGKKNARGFYVWDKVRKQVDDSVYSDLGLSTPHLTSISNGEVTGRGIYRMINEAALALHEEKIVQSASDIDVAMILGAGFPPFRGGLLRYADSVGSVAIVDQLEMWASKYGARFTPTHPLRNMAKTQRCFTR